MLERSITLSIVSHRQNTLVNLFLDDLATLCVSDVQVILTENVRDACALKASGFAFPITVIQNAERKGFGANHNAAFVHCTTPYYAVVNPDVRLPANPFPALIDALRDGKNGVVGPLVRDPAGITQASAQRFPTPRSLVRKALTGVEDQHEHNAGQVDWVAGMFMVFRSDAYRAVGGFDERYFLYYEDADICRRLQRAGFGVMHQPAAAIVHDARRGSHRSARLAAHHVASMLRFLASS